jgi:hypothetical protein
VFIAEGGERDPQLGTKRERVRGPYHTITTSCQESAARDEPLNFGVFVYSGTVLKSFKGAICCIAGKIAAVVHQRLPRHLITDSDYQRLMKQMENVESVRKFTRAEMNFR